MPHRKYTYNEVKEIAAKYDTLAECKYIDKQYKLYKNNYVVNQ